MNSIVDATIELLRTYDLHEITLSMIADQAKISRTSIYSYFPSVEAVFRAMSEQFVDESWEEVYQLAAASEPRTLQEVVESVIDAVCVYFDQHPAATKLHLGSDESLQLLAMVEDADRLAATMYHRLISVNWAVAHLSEADPFRLLVIMQLALFTTSVKRHGKITELFASQAKVMARAYMSAIQSDMHAIQRMPQLDIPGGADDRDLDERLSAALETLKSGNNPLLIQVAVTQLEALAWMSSRKATPGRKKS